MLYRTQPPSVISNIIRKITEKLLTELIEIIAHDNLHNIYCLHSDV